MAGRGAYRDSGPSLSLIHPAAEMASFRKLRRNKESRGYKGGAGAKLLVGNALLEEMYSCCTPAPPDGRP